ncbi:MAG: tetratricopeptide repeat protein [Candidatus Alcyoniella australis]|nr:tetratricopeptide repeat protein [Candidatus Alcyoniella australis]
MRPTQLRAAALSNQRLRGLDLRGMDLRDASFADCGFERCRLEGLRNARFINCTLERTSLELGQGPGCQWSDCRFDRCDIALYGRAPRVAHRTRLCLQRRARGLSCAVLKLLPAALRLLWRMLKSLWLLSTAAEPLGRSKSRRIIRSVLGALAVAALLTLSWLMLQPDLESMSIEQLNLRAANLSAANRPGAAAQVYGYIIEQRAAPEQRHHFSLLQAGSLVEAGRIEEAIEVYQRLIDQGATPEIYLNLGTLIETSRGAQQAREFYGESLKRTVDPGLRSALEGQLRRLGGLATE